MEEQMKTIEHLKRLKETNNSLLAEREQKFLKSLRGKLEIYISQNPVRHRSQIYSWQKEGLKNFINFKFIPSNFIFARPKAISAIMLVLALSAGGMAAASQDSLPGDKLYGVKILSEEVRSKLALSPSSKANLESDFAAKRIEEIKKTIAEKGAEAEGIDIALLNLQKNSANAADIIDSEKQKGKDVSELAKNINGKMNNNRNALKQIFKDEIKSLKDQEKELKNKIKEAIAAGNSALAGSLTAQLEELKNKKETLEMSRDEHDDYIELEAESVQNSMKDDEKRSEQKNEAQKAITEAGDEKHELNNELDQEKIIPDPNMFSGFDSLIAQAKDALAKENFEKAKELAEEAKESLGEIKEDMEFENENDDIDNGEENKIDNDTDSEERSLKNGGKTKYNSSTIVIKNAYKTKKENHDLLPISQNQNSGGVINRVSTDKKIVALTFDADMTYGMEQDLKSGRVKSWYNEELINELKKNQTPATLFLTGLWIENYPEITKELAANPLFELANHSYSHPGFTTPCFKLPTIPDSSDDQEITKTDDLLKKYAPNYKKYFRFPGFCHDNFDVAEAEKYGYKVIDGDVKGLDGFTYDAEGIASRIVSHAKPGSIIVLHMHGGSNAPKTGEALPEIIRQLKEKGYTFVKVSELLNDK